ncbi:uncharacterized protein ALTATR162_LOCUS40 [Alternaria atra]|uniref:Uncharacterized protein n=1 Tax=Alternaria atra TaxID=119953 RepID=A0A8J2HRA1_9PLEO|nr:uncharacterized protein ALTATR162_LOCUS40 [Alternaria atra]CAG5137099.1 unnamed protein product [Alternaria atra]
MATTYGMINGLAADFFSTKGPICLGTTFEEQKTRFRQAFADLANPANKKALTQLVDFLADESKQIQAAYDKGDSEVSKTYDRLSSMFDNMKLQVITAIGLTDGLTYINLAKINFDHFSQDARTAYNAGYAVAINEALNKNLERAYAMNAFADHFLEDSFSAGHLRTPRRFLTDHLGAKDGCAKEAYGDKRLFDEVNHKNMLQIREALQASTDEIWAAYYNGDKLELDTYKAWSYAPVLRNVKGKKNAMFYTQDKKLYYRKDITNPNGLEYAETGVLAWVKILAALRIKAARRGKTS